MISMSALALFITCSGCLRAGRGRHLCQKGSKIRQLLLPGRFLRGRLRNRILLQFSAFGLDNTFSSDFLCRGLRRAFESRK